MLALDLLQECGVLARDGRAGGRPAAITAGVEGRGRRAAGSDRCGAVVPGAAPASGWAVRVGLWTNANPNQHSALAAAPRLGLYDGALQEGREAVA